MPPISLDEPTGRYLSFAEREEIALLRAQLWGMPASRRWFYEASEFPGEPVHEPQLMAGPSTLEDFLGLH